MCNLFYATTQICSCMCRMQLKFSCKRQLQNPKFLVVNEAFESTTRTKFKTSCLMVETLSFQKHLLNFQIHMVPIYNFSSLCIEIHFSILLFKFLLNVFMIQFYSTYSFFFSYLKIWVFHFILFFNVHWYII
jgi:hypothetical protein